MEEENKGIGRRREEREKEIRYMETKTKTENMMPSI